MKRILATAFAAALLGPEAARPSRSRPTTTRPSTSRQYRTFSYKDTGDIKDDRLDEADRERAVGHARGQGRQAGRERRRRVARRAPAPLEADAGEHVQHGLGLRIRLVRRDGRDGNDGRHGVRDPGRDDRSWTSSTEEEGHGVARHRERHAEHRPLAPNEDREKKLREVAAEMFAGYPPRRSSRLTGYPRAHADAGPRLRALLLLLRRGPRLHRGRETRGTAALRRRRGPSRRPRHGRDRRLRPPRSPPRVHVLGGRRPLRPAARPDRRGGQRHRDRVAAPRPPAGRRPAEAPGRVPEVHGLADRDVPGVLGVGPRGRAGRIRPLRRAPERDLGGRRGRVPGGSARRPRSSSSRPSTR